MRVEPRAFLTDFGLAKSVSTGSRLTRTGQALGTPAYMSPEQARGEVSALSPATDVWSAGCVLYEMLAGRRCFLGDTAAEVVGRILTGSPPPLRRLRPDMPPVLEAIVRASLARSPTDRYRDAGALGDDLGAVLDGRRPAALPRGRAWPRLLAALIVAFLAGTLGWATLGAGRSPEAAPGPVARGAEGAAEAIAARAGAERHSDPREAITLLTRALELRPERGDWRVDRGLLLWALGDAVAAREEWGRVAPSSPERSRARFFMALEAMARLEGEGLGFSEAKPHLAEAAAGEGPIAALAEALVVMAPGDYARARNLLRGLGGWEAALLRGYLEGTDPRGDRSAAFREYSIALEEGIPFSWALCNRGSARLDLEDLRGALADFDAALALRPGFVMALRGKAEARRLLGDLPAALADCREALRLRPDDTACWNSLGLIREAGGDLRGAISDYEEVLRRDPDHFFALYNRGHARHSLGDLPGALEDYDRALRLRPGDAGTLTNRGHIRRVLGDLAGAVADHDAALAARPGWAGALYNRGIARLHLGEAAAALEDFSAALRSEPTHAEAQCDRGIARERLGDREGALADFDACLRLRPDYVPALNNRGALRRRAGDTAGALADFRAAVRIEPARPEPHLNLGIQLQDVGNLAEARAELEEFLRLAPNHPGAADARARLGRIPAGGGGK